jgi:hypothetical protein
MINLLKRFKNLTKKKTYCVLMTLLFAGACQQEEPNLADPESVSAPGVLELSYDVEHVLRPGLPESGNTDNVPSYEKVLSRPFSGKNNVHVSLYDDGTSAWRIEKAKPTIDLSIKHETPQGKEAKAVVTVIDRSGQARFYDKDNTLLFQHKMDIPTYKDVVAGIKEGYSPVFAVMGMPAAQRMETLLTQAKNNGAIIQHLDGGIVSVRTEAGKVIPGASARNSQTLPLTMVQLFSEKSGLLVGATLYDGQTVVNQVFYSFAFNNQKQLVPYRIHSETWDNHPGSGERVKTESQIHFSNVLVTLNK